MKRFTGWRSSAAEDDGQQASPPEHSPTRSQLSNNSTNSRGASSSLRSGYTAPKSREQSPARFGAASADTLGAAAGSSGGAVVAVSSKKMLKIGANVRFRGDVMECNTVVLCGRLQGFVETQRMTIKEGGMFIGDAKVEEADVYGSLDGSLESTAKVSIHSTGSVSGNVIYKKMTMEDGGELEGTFECRNRAGGRLRNREGSATGGVGGLRRGSRDDSGALAVRDNQNTISPPGKQSPILWQNGQGAAYAGGAAAAAAAAAGDEVWVGGGRVGAAFERAGGGGGTGGTGAGGSGSGSVMSSVARLEASPRGNPVTPGGTAAATTPVGVGTGGGALRRITPTGAGLFTAARAPSPLRSTRGLQVQGLGAEAGELFSEEAVTPVGESGAGVTDLPSARSRRSSATVGGGGGGGGDGSAEEEGTSGGGGTSVAARVGTWPPPSPVPSSTRLWQRRTENHTTPAPAPSPAPPSTTAAPPAQTSGSITQNTVKSLVESNKPPPLQGTTTASQRQQQKQPGSGSAASRTLVSPSVVDLAGSGPVGNGDGVTGGGAGVGRMGIAAEEKLDNYESALEEFDSDSAPKISGPVKACEVDGCALEACWGDPRFRPRYCARHKKQGNKLMSPVEAEERDTSAASPEASPPMEPLPSPSKPLTDLKLGARGLPSVQPVEPPNGSGGAGGGHSTESDGLESDEDEDEGWDSGGGAAVVAAVGGRLVAAANGGSNLGGTSGGSGGGFSGGGGRGGGGGGGFGVQPALPVVQAELVGNDDDHRHHNPYPEGYDEPKPVGYGGYGAAGGGGGGGGAADAEAEDADDVQARVAAYTRLAGGKKQPQTTAHVPSLPKPRAQKPKKRASATNIADFYGGGESDDDEEETGFNMDAYNKGVLLNQAAEVGTHTEDGQLRPQASSERDQQKLAHLVRVGKLGAALRGKGVTSGKRR